MKVLRGLLGVFAGFTLAATASAQNTTLSIDGVSSIDNSASVDVAAGSTMTIQITNTTAGNRPYGLFGALATTGAPTGWFLAASGPKRPYPIITGVATSQVEADYGVDIFPDRSANPAIRLKANGTVTLTLNVPKNITATLFFQAVSLPLGALTTDLSNAVTVNVVASTAGARLLVSQSSVGVDNVQYGVLEWNNGDPTTATFTQPDATLANIKPDVISMGDISEWSLHFGSSVADKAREVDWRSATFGPAINNDSHEYIRISLPPLAGADAILGTADDIPSRDLVRAYDNVTQEAFYLVINRGANPNTPGVDFFTVPGTRKKDSITATLNSWKAACQVSPDGSRMAAIYDDSSTAAGFDPQMFLIAIDGSTPYLDANNLPVAVVNVTPTGTKNFNSANNVRTSIFTNNRFWFTRDVGTTADADARNDMTLWTVDTRAVKPLPTQVTVNPNTLYNSGTVTAAVDSYAERSMMIPRGGGTVMCFLVGDTIVAASGTVPEHVLRGDWYAVSEANPSLAVNLTKFQLYGSTGTTVPKMLVPGDAYNGNGGFACMSPDGTRLAFVSLHSQENPTAGEDDEVYLCSTRDADGNGEGDDAGTLFQTSRQITTNARINSGSGGGGNTNFDNSHDLYLSDADTLFFFYGIDASTTDRQMDLFAWSATSSVLSNVTTPAKTAPFNTVGTVFPEGYFFSPNFRYLYFSRGINGAGIVKTNLVGVDTTTRKAFNVTGTEYAGASTGDTTNTGAAGENFGWHLSYAGGSYPSLCYFAAPLLSVTTATQEWQQIWVFDANYPTAAIQLTNDSTAGNAKQNVDSLTGNPFGLGCVWGWERSTSASADVEYQDLLYYFRDVLSNTVVPFTSSLTLAGFDWARAATASDPNGAAPPALICAIGDNGTDHASDAEFYYFLLDGTTDYDFDNAAQKHQVGTTALSGLPFTGFIEIYSADVK